MQSNFKMWHCCSAFENKRCWCLRWLGSFQISDNSSKSLAGGRGIWWTFDFIFSKAPAPKEQKSHRSNLCLVSLPGWRNLHLSDSEKGKVSQEHIKAEIPLICALSHSLAFRGLHPKLAREYKSPGMPLSWTPLSLHTHALPPA